MPVPSSADFCCDVDSEGYGRNVCALGAVPFILLLASKTPVATRAAVATPRRLYTHGTDIADCGGELDCRGLLVGCPEPSVESLVPEPVPGLRAGFDPAPVPVTITEPDPELD
jgi:hypothetical protein